MKKFKCPCALFLIILLTGGCARLTEITKTIWGSSTRDLEEARIDSARGVYKCSYEDCFDAVLEIAKSQEDPLEIFIQDRIKSRIVLMSIPESVDTTEVGVFFLGLGATETKVEVASMSPFTQEKAADIIFSGLKKKFVEVK